MTSPATAPARFYGGPADKLLDLFPEVPAPRLLTLPGLLAACVDRHGDRVAAIEGGRRVTFTDLDRESAALRDRLLDEGVGPGVRVGVRLPNSIDFATALFGVARTGATAVLLSTLWTDAETDQAIAATGVSLLLSPELTVVGPFRATAPGGDTAASPDDGAVILFTSGTTGRPKAVLHTHRSPCLQSLRWAPLHGFTPDDVLLSTSPFFWSSGLVKSLGAALVAGTALVTLPRLGAAATLEQLERHGVTALISPLHLDHQIVQDPTFAARDLSRLRKVHRRSPLKAALGIDRQWDPGGYGLSEMCTLAASVPAAADHSGLAGATGWVLPGADVKIVDQETAEPVPFGQVGRICVRGETLMCGYEGHPNPFDAEGYLPTSDSGELDAEGRLWFRGRLDSLVRSGGTNLSPAEVEQALEGWHRLTRAVVVAVPHPVRGQALVLCAVPTDDTVTADDVRTRLRERLAGYKLPRRIILVPTDALRYTATGKVDPKHARTLAVSHLARDEPDAHWRALLAQESA